MSEKKFKIGDRVKFIGQSRDLDYLGKINTNDYGTIIDFDGVSKIYLINVDNSTFWVYETELEIVKFDDGGLLSKMRDTLDDTKGIKHDQGKPKLSLLTKESLIAEAKAFEYGAAKYKDKHNYKNGMEWSRIIDAAMRHIVAFSNKEDFDEESKLNHIWHAKACLAMLIYYYENKVGTDDR